VLAGVLDGGPDESAAIISRSAARLSLSVLVWISWLSRRQNMHQQPLAGR
jgi:hypothetical protein